MSEDGKYNGWSNYPTWAVNLWLSNEEPLYNEARDMARTAIEETELDEDAEAPGPGEATPADEARYMLATRLENWVKDELAPDLGVSFAADLLGWALGSVDWDEIATSWLEDVA